MKRKKQNPLGLLNCQQFAHTDYYNTHVWDYRETISDKIALGNCFGLPNIVLVSRNELSYLSITSWFGQLYSLDPTNQILSKKTQTETI